MNVRKGALVFTIDITDDVSTFSGTLKAVPLELWIIFKFVDPTLILVEGGAFAGGKEFAREL